jgi:hypothetical protein
MMELANWKGYPMRRLIKKEKKNKQRKIKRRERKEDGSRANNKHAYWSRDMNPRN